MIDDKLSTEDVRELSGTATDQGVVVDSDAVEHGAEFTDTQRDELETEPTGEVRDLIGLGSDELRDGETDDPNVASEEGLAYIPPTDPPDNDNLGDPFERDPVSESMSAEDDLAVRVRDALRADSATAQYAEDVEIRSSGGIVVLRGMVDDIDDTDALAEVASSVAGVVEVRDELGVAGL